MVGDAYDFGVLLDCVRAICDDSEEAPDGEIVSAISDGTRRLLVNAFGQLLRAFSAAETAHRAEFAVSVGILCLLLRLQSADHEYTQENALYYKELMDMRERNLLIRFPTPKWHDHEHADDVSFVV